MHGGDLVEHGVALFAARSVGGDDGRRAHQIECFEQDATAHALDDDEREIEVGRHGLRRRLAEQEAGELVVLGEPPGEVARAHELVALLVAGQLDVVQRVERALDRFGARAGAAAHERPRGRGERDSAANTEGARAPIRLIGERAGAVAVDLHQVHCQSDRAGALQLGSLARLGDVDARPRVAHCIVGGEQVAEQHVGFGHDESVVDFLGGGQGPSDSSDHRIDASVARRVLDDGDSGFDEVHAERRFGEAVALLVGQGHRPLEVVDRFSPPSELGGDLAQVVQALHLDRRRTSGEDRILDVAQQPIGLG